MKVKKCTDICKKIGKNDRFCRFYLQNVVLKDHRRSHKGHLVTFYFQLLHGKLTTKQPQLLWAHSDILQLQETTSGMESGAGLEIPH